MKILQAAQLLFKIPTGLSSLAGVRLSFGVGMFGSGFVSNGTYSIYIQSDNNAPWTWCINSTIFGTAASPHNNWRIGSWNQLTISNTGNGDCKFELASATGPDNKTIISLYNYSDVALTGIVSLIGGIWESCIRKFIRRNV